jgi:hypothetical protein
MIFRLKLDDHLVRRVASVARIRIMLMLSAIRRYSTFV